MVVKQKTVTIYMLVGICNILLQVKYSQCVNPADEDEFYKAWAYGDQNKGLEDFADWKKGQKFCEQFKDRCKPRKGEITFDKIETYAMVSKDKPKGNPNGQEFASMNVKAICCIMKQYMKATKGGQDFIKNTEWKISPMGNNRYCLLTELGKAQKDHYQLLECHKMSIGKKGAFIGWFRRLFNV